MIVQENSTMGYETRLHIGIENPHAESTVGKVDGEYRYIWSDDDQQYYYDTNDNKVNCSVPKIQAQTDMSVAMVDLCKCGDSFHTGIKKLAPLPQRMLYGKNDSYVIVEDAYGESVKTYLARDILNVLLNAQDSAEPYRRFTTAIALLRSMVGDYDDLVVTTYGH